MTHIKYDYLIVGSGLFGAVFAYKVKSAGKRVLVIEKRGVTGGNVHCGNIEGINVHEYGAHIFHTNNKEVWQFVNQFVEFNRFTNSPLANYQGKLYNLPFNMNTFYTLWGVKTPAEAKRKIHEQREKYMVSQPSNLEEQALSLVGKDIYEILIKEYTEKQWGRECKELPVFIINRLPVRFTFDNNYYEDKYQGIPIGGYNKLINKLLDNIDIITNADYFDDRAKYENATSKIVYTGRIDKYFDYAFDALAYRGIRLETELLNEENYQGNAVINFTSKDEKYTRIIEHKHFEFGKQSVTVISKEYPVECGRADEPFYPVNDTKNMQRYNKYKKMSKKEGKVIFGGRLAEYKYYNMDQVIERACFLAEESLK
jgi:UDP-galactopyranose mutase